MKRKRKQKLTGMRRRHDPHAGREASRYEQPIASRELILEVIAEAGSPINRDAVARVLDIHDDTGQEALRRRLQAMVRDGQLVRNRRGCYALADQFDLVQGRVIGHPDGFGFLVPDDGSEDVYLSARQMRSVYHEDRVQARIAGKDRRGRREGEVVEVLQRNTHRVVGRFYRESGINFVVPDNKRLTHDISVPDTEMHGAAHGQIVTVEILEQPGKRHRPVGRVIEVLGEHLAPGMEIDIAIRSHDLPQEWPAECRAVATCARCRWSPLTVRMHAISMMPCSASASRPAGVCWWRLPMCRTTCCRIRPSTTRPSGAATPCTSRNGSSRCCPRCCPTACVH